MVIRRGDWQNVAQGTAAAGGSSVEWKVPLASMENLSGRFIRVYTHALPQYNLSPSEDHLPCNRIGPLTSVTGTIDIPDYDGTGAVYIEVFKFTGTKDTGEENRVGLTIIYPGQFTPGMTYTVTGLPVGEEVFVAVRWDADYSGIPTRGDYLGSTAPFILTPGTTTRDLQAATIYAADRGSPFFRFCNVQALNTPLGIQASYTAQVLDPDGAVPFTIASVTVTGPGVNYSFAAGDFINNAFYLQISGSAPSIGEYTFTVTDIQGKSSTSRFYYGGGAQIPLPSAETLQASGDPLIPTLSWGAAGHGGNLFYRARIFDAEGTSIIWTSGFTPSNIVNVPYGVLLEGVQYQWRAEAFDKYTFEVSNQRAVSGRIPLTIDNASPFYRYAAVSYRIDANGTRSTQLMASISDPNGTVPSSIQNLRVYSSANELIYSFQSADYSPALNEYYKILPEILPEGIYRFEVTDTEGKTKTAHDFLKSAILPPVDHATLQASGDPLAPKLAWSAPDGMDRPVYYRVIVEAAGSSARIWSSDRISNTSLTMPSGRLQEGQSYRWNVRATDSPYFGHYDAESRSSFKSLVIDTTAPFFEYAGVYKRYHPDGVFTHVGARMGDPNGILPSSIQSLTVAGPGGFSQKLTGSYVPEINQFAMRISGPPEPGIYTFTLVDTDGIEVVSRDWVGAAADIPLVDEAGIQVSGDPTAPTVSWSAPSGYPGSLF